MEISTNPPAKPSPLTTWACLVDGRITTLTGEQIIDLIKKGAIHPDTPLQQTGTTEWVQTKDSPFHFHLPKHAPSNPSPSDPRTQSDDEALRKGNTLAWTLALMPLGVAVLVSIGKALWPATIDSLGKPYAVYSVWAFPIWTFILSYEKDLTRAGSSTTSLPPPWVALLLMPYYLYARSEALKQPPTAAITNACLLCGLLLLTIM